MARVLLVALLTFAVARTSRTASPKRAAIAQVAFGAMTLAASATIAIAYATKIGLTTRTIAGSAATLGSLALLVGGLISLGRGAHGWRRWLIAPVGLVVAFVIVSAVFPAVYATNVPRPPLGSQRPSDRGLNYSDATFETVDGFTLRGWYIPPTNRAAVVLLHGASSTRTSVLDQAVVLAHHGYGVLLFDARGHGQSEGRAMEFGWYGDRDIAAAVTYLQTRSDVDPQRIAAVGMSMGGEEAIGAMATDGRIRAAVAEGATNRVYADTTWLADEYGIRGGAQLAIEWLTYHLADFLTAASPPTPLRRAVQEASPRPILLIAAGKVKDEQLVGESLRANAPGNVTLWVADGADHTGGLAARPAEWTRQVTDFLDAAMAGAGS
ncbi:MAG: alpha/beta hydrolase [Ilumatobacteraceae bacterium]